MAIGPPATELFMTTQGLSAFSSIGYASCSRGEQHRQPISMDDARSANEVSKRGKGKEAQQGAPGALACDRLKADWRFVLKIRWKSSDVNSVVGLRMFVPTLFTSQAGQQSKGRERFNHQVHSRLTAIPTFPIFGPQTRLPMPFMR